MCPEKNDFNDFRKSIKLKQKNCEILTCENYEEMLAALKPTARVKRTLFTKKVARRALKA